MSYAHWCVLPFTHLIGKDSREQNADAVVNEAITVGLSVYLAICQFNNLWLLVVFCEELPLSIETLFLQRNLLSFVHYPVVNVLSLDKPTNEERFLTVPVFQGGKYENS